MTIRSRILALALITAAPVAAQDPPCLGGLDFETQVSPGLAASGDVDGDGHEDVLLAHAFGFPFLSLHRADGAGGLGPSESQPILPMAVGQLCLRDLDEDCDLDALALPGAALLNDGTGRFGEPLPLPLPFTFDPRESAVGDVDGDGRLDVAIKGWDAIAAAFPMLVFLGQGDGTFELSSVPIGSGDEVSSWFQLVDWNGDGHQDLVGLAFALDGSVGTEPVVLAGSGSGSFAAPAALTSLGGGSYQGLHVAELDGDGRPDLVTVSSPGSAVMTWVTGGDAGLAFGGVTVLDTSPVGFLGDVEALDVDGDGDRDVVMTRLTLGDTHLLVNDGTGTLALARELLPERFATGFARADLDGDGLEDLVVADLFGDRVLTLHGAADSFARLGFGGGQVSLDVSGSTQPDAVLTLAVGGPVPGAPAAVLASTDGAPQPLAGGVLVPLNPVLLPTLSGGVVRARWPVSLAPGDQLVLQAWAQVPGGVSASDAVAAVGL
jgi:hypothetical protein